MLTENLWDAGDLLAAVINGATSPVSLKGNWLLIPPPSSPHVASRISTLGVGMKKKRLFHEIRSRIEEEEEEGAFKIPVVGGEPITVALKYGNRGAGSAYRRLDKRCDARSIGPPTDPCARAPFLSLSLSLSLSAPLSPARNHLLCTWLEADCYPGILPFLRLSWPASSPDTWSRSTAIAIARISFSVRDRPPIENGNKGAFEVSRSILDTRGNLSLCLCFNSSSDLNSLVKVADFIARDFIALYIIFVLRWLRSWKKVEIWKCIG